MRLIRLTAMKSAATSMGRAGASHDFADVRSRDGEAELSRSRPRPSSIASRASNRSAAATASVPGDRSSSFTKLSRTSR